MSANRLVHVARRDRGCVTFIGINGSRSHHQAPCRAAGCIVAAERLDRLPIDEARALPWFCPAYARHGASPEPGSR